MRSDQRSVGRSSTSTRVEIVIAPYDRAWPTIFARERARILGALGSRALEVEHVGSTAVPGLAAKDRIDIDLIVDDPAAEDDYVPYLEDAGYSLRTRDPDWYEHRCLWTDDHGVNLHVFGPDCDEFLRHIILRDWLRGHPADRRRYEAKKRRIAAQPVASMADYVEAKRSVIVDILRKAGLT